MDDCDYLIVENLLQLNPTVFSQYFTLDGCELNVDPSVATEAKTLFEEKYPDLSFENLVEKYKNFRKEEVSIPQSQICNRLVFDPRMRRNVTVMGPAKKRIKRDFDAYTFLSTRLESGIPIRFSSEEDLESDMDILLEAQKESVIDAALRKIAQVLSVLNESCNYKLMDVLSERVIR